MSLEQERNNPVEQSSVIEALRALQKVASDLDADAKREREAGESMYAGGIESYESDDPADIADGLIFGAEFSEKRAAEIRAALSILSARQEVAPVAGSMVLDVLVAGGYVDPTKLEQARAIVANLSHTQTSEARDAVDVADVHIVVDFIFRHFGQHWNVGPALTDDVVAAVRRVEAAMRQEGGKPEATSTDDDDSDTEPCDFCLSRSCGGTCGGDCV